MKRYIFAFILFASFKVSAQKIDSIYVDLYTDSLKKGTYNYINIDGKLQNGNYLPLDSSQISFTADGGEFFGNSLFIDKDFNRDKVIIYVVLKQNPKVKKEFTIYIKQKPDNERLRTTEEIINSTDRSGKKKRSNLMLASGPNDK